MGNTDTTVKEVRHIGSATVIVLTGEVDLHHTPGVHKALVAACQEHPERLVVNLEEVTYMDSSGIGTLVEVFRRVNSYKGKLLLCGMNDRVHSVFTITRLDKLFRIYKTQEEALSA